MGPGCRGSGLVNVGPATGPEGGMGLAHTARRPQGPHPCATSPGPVWHFLRWQDCQGARCLLRGPHSVWVFPLGSRSGAFKLERQVESSLSQGFMGLN